MNNNAAPAKLNNYNGHRDTKQRILDIAEKLFARDGFHCTSLRTITGDAGVNLAAVNYHFGSKEALLEAVFERRLLPLNRVRTEKLGGALTRAKNAGRRPKVSDIMRAFIGPTIRFRETGPGAQDFVSLVGRSMADPDPTVRNIFIRHITPLFYLLFDALKEALPDLQDETLFWRLHFALGALSHTMNICGKIRPEDTPVQFTRDSESLINMLVTFIKAGMSAK
jgi:AcrR family transcriptional regulator